MSEEPDHQQHPEPFLKWAGGKRMLLSRLSPYLRPPRASAQYFEPFLGGGAMFFHLQPPKAVLSDIIEPLLETYELVRDDVESVITHLSRLDFSEETYYRTRASRPKSPAKRAAHFIYLNKTCFNGLYRVNSHGAFNVPIGRHGPNLRICDGEQLRRASRSLRGALIGHMDFEEALEATRDGDVIYCDPPYTVAHRLNGFVEYNATVFSWADQRRLAAAAIRATDRGASVYISNAWHPAIRRLYPKKAGFSAIRIDRWSTMAASAEKRFQTSEALIIGASGG